MSGPDFLPQRFQPVGAGFHEYLVLGTCPEFAFPLIDRVHFRQNVYTRGQFFFTPDPGLLFGAIEIGYTHGPFLLNRNYRLTSEVICVGQSPQTEYVWYETEAYNEADELVATMRMQGRSMKASSAAYQQ